MLLNELELELEKKMKEEKSFGNDYDLTGRLLSTVLFVYLFNLKKKIRIIIKRKAFLFIYWTKEQKQQQNLK